MSIVLRYILVSLIAYLLGSISTGILVSNATEGPDLRTVGSKNTGATNALRVMGAKRGLITFLGDVLKAIISCLIGQWIIGNVYGSMVAGFFVIVGHNWPCFFQFKGGKGVSCSCAALLVCFPIPALVSFVFGATAIAVTRFVSLGSMLVVTVFAIIVSVTYSSDPVVIIWSIIIALMCIIRHRANLVRLIHGKENKISFSKK